MNVNHKKAFAEFVKIGHPQKFNEHNPNVVELNEKLTVKKFEDICKKYGFKRNPFACWGVDIDYGPSKIYSMTLDHTMNSIDFNKNQNTVISIDCY